MIATLFKRCQWMTSVAQARASNMSVPSEGYYLINRVEELWNISLNKYIFKYYGSFWILSIRK